MEQAEPDLLIQRGSGPVGHYGLSRFADPGTKVRTLPGLYTPPSKVRRGQRLQQQSRSSCSSSCCCCGRRRQRCRLLLLLCALDDGDQVGVAVLRGLDAPLNLGQDRLVDGFGSPARSQGGGGGFCGGCGGSAEGLPRVQGVQGRGGVEPLDVLHVADAVEETEPHLVLG